MGLLLLLDEDAPLTAFLGDTMAPAESLQKTVERLLGDTLTPSESLTVGRIVHATLGDTLGITEAEADVLGRQFADAPSIAEAFLGVAVSGGGGASPATTAKRKARWTEICRLLTITLVRDLGSQIIGLQDGTSAPDFVANALATDSFRNRKHLDELGPNWTPYTAGGWQGLKAFDVSSVIPGASEFVAVAAAVAPGTTPASGDTGEVYTALTPSANQFAEVKAFYGVSRTDPIAAGAWLRCADPPTRTYYGLVGFSTAGGGGGAIYKVVNGTYTLIASVSSIPWVIGDVVRGEVIGTTLILYRNGVAILTATDSAIASGKVGLGCFVPSTGQQLDLALTAWRGGSLQAGATHQAGTLLTTQITREKVVRVSDRYWRGVLDQDWLPLVVSWPSSTGPGILAPLAPGLSLQTADFTLSDQRRIGGQARFSALFRHGARDSADLYDIGKSRVAYDWLFRGAGAGEQVPIFRGVLDDYEADEHTLTLRCNSDETRLKPAVREVTAVVGPVVSLDALFITSFEECVVRADLEAYIFAAGIIGLDVVASGRTGGTALILDGPSVQTGLIRCVSPTDSTVFIRFWFKVDALSASKTCGLLYLDDANGIAVSAGVGELAYGGASDGSGGVSQGQQVAVGEWYRLEIKIVCGGTAPRVRARTYTATGELHDLFESAVALAWTNLRLGWTTTGPGVSGPDLLIDDLTIVFRAGDVDGELGDTRVGYARLASTSKGEWGTVEPVGAQHHTVLDSAPGSPDDTDYVEGTADAQVEQFGLVRATVLSDASILTRLCVRGRHELMGSVASHHIRVIDPAGQVFEAARAAVPNTGDPESIEAHECPGFEVFLPAPLLDACQVGTRHVTSGNGNMRLYELFAAFEYIPSA